MTAAEHFAAHVSGLRAENLSQAARAAVANFTLDTIGVGVAGAAQPYAEAFAAVIARGAGPAARWGRGGGLSPAEAAAINAFQAHCQEFDCVHEAAVLHPFTVVVPVLLAEAQARGMRGHDYLAACAAGVDVAAGLGVAAKSQIKFFRPATCGLFGATAALARARGLDASRTADAFGYALAFAAGTMQAHVEGTPALAASVGAAARAAFDSVGLAEAGLPGPRGAIDGPFGYLALFETASDIAPVLDDLGRAQRVAEVSWKPFPTGRAAHGGIDMTLALRADGLVAEALESLIIEAPPLIHHLVGRPIKTPLEVNYARLCLPYVAAHALRFGAVGLDAFTPTALADPLTHVVAARISVLKTDHPDPAAFTPQRAIARTTDGRRLEARAAVLLGAPARPLSGEAQAEKLRGCFAYAGLSVARADGLIAAVGGLQDLSDVGVLAQLVGEGGPA